MTVTIQHDTLEPMKITTILEQIEEEEKRHISIRAWAKRLGISINTVQRLQKGLPVQVSTKKKVSYALGRDWKTIKF